MKNQNYILGAVVLAAIGYYFWNKKKQAQRTATNGGGVDTGGFGTPPTAIYHGTPIEIEEAGIKPPQPTRRRRDTISIADTVPSSQSTVGAIDNYCEEKFAPMRLSDAAKQQFINECKEQRSPLFEQSATT